MPVVGCDCAVCTSSDPGNVRTRCSFHLQTPEVSVLIDTGPDLREQALRENLREVDAVYRFVWRVWIRPNMRDH